MPTKTLPEMQVWCSPIVPETRFRATSFGLSDTLANLNRGTGKNTRYTGFLSPQSGTQEGDSPGGAHVQDVENLHWWDLWDEDDKTKLNGYTVAPRIVPMSSVLVGEKKLNPPTSTVTLPWCVGSGEDDYWQTCLPDREPQAAAVRHSRADMGHTAHAWTDTPLPQNQRFRLELQCLGVAKSDNAGLQPWIRITWGGGYCLYLVAGQMPVLGRQGGGRLTPLRHMPQLSQFWGYSVCQTDLHYLAGRMILSNPDGQNTIYTNRIMGQNPARAGEYDKEGTVVPVVARQAPLQVEAQGVAFTLRTHEIAFADGVPEQVERKGSITPRLFLRSSAAKGSFKRSFYGNVSSGSCEGYAYGYYPEKIGSQAQGIRPERIGKVEIEDGEQGLQRYYRCTLEADAPDVELQPAGWRNDLLTYSGRAMRGHTTPFVHSVGVQAAPRWRQVTTADPVDIRPAILQATETCADPGLQTGLSWTFQADRNVLPDIAHPAGGSLGNDWSNYVNKYHPIRVFVGWQYDDGVVRGKTGQGDSAPGPVVMRLAGYQTGMGPGAPAYGRRTLEITARDPICKLQAPASMVDHQYAALDLLMTKKLVSAGPRRQAALYGADAVQYILQTALGPSGSDLAVYYPGYSGIWSWQAKPNHWSLMDHKIYTDPPSGGGGMMWPPPFGSSALDWISTIAEVDFAVFFYAPTPFAPNLVPTYGNYFSYVGGAPTTILTDADYYPDAVNAAVQSGDWRQVPESDYNRVLVWGQVPGSGDLGGLMPALPQFSAEAVIGGSPIPEQNANITWERTKLLQGTQFYMPGVARMVARLSSWLMWGVDVRRVSVRARGIEWLWWGHKVQLLAQGVSSDPALDFRQPGGALQTFRVMRVQNQYDLAAGNWDSIITLADQPVMNPYG